MLDAARGAVARAGRVLLMWTVLLAIVALVVELVRLLDAEVEAQRGKAGRRPRQAAHDSRSA